MTGRLEVTRDGRVVGTLERPSASVYETDYEFRYAHDATVPISVALPLQSEAFSPQRTSAFFEALLPEGALRDAIADRLRLGSADSFGLLAALGRDCAGALQIVDTGSAPRSPGVQWLEDADLVRLIDELPLRPLGLGADERMRLSLAGAQSKLVLVRDRRDGRFGQALDGMATTHLVKPEPRDSRYPGIAVNEFFCMQLAQRVGLPAADTELVDVGTSRCLVVTRFDRELDATPVTRLHQEDLCQAIGISPSFKYATPDRPRPSFADVGEVLARHGAQPGRDRLTAARAAVFNFLIGNADAHGKNVSFVHRASGKVRLAPLYDLVSTAAWPQLDATLAMAIGDEFDPSHVGLIHFDDLAEDLRLNVTAFKGERARFVELVTGSARELRDRAERDRWGHPTLDVIVRTIDERADRVI